MDPSLTVLVPWAHQIALLQFGLPYQVKAPECGPSCRMAMDRETRNGEEPERDESKAGSAMPHTRDLHCSHLSR